VPASARLEGEPVGGRFFGQSSFATHTLATERNVVKVPADLPLELARHPWLRIQTGAGAILRALAMKSGETALVFVSRCRNGCVMAAIWVAQQFVIESTYIPSDLRWP